TALDLVREGVLEKFEVELIAASRAAIDMAEDRELFRNAMREIGLETPQSQIARSLDEALAIAGEIGYPVVVRPSFTLGGSGGGIGYNREELETIVARGLDASPTGEVLLEESVIGWKEFEMEVVRDQRDNCIIICSIENLDPMGVHTGDSITIAPALTLTDKEYQRMRDAAVAVLRKIGVDTGGSNVQFAVNPSDGRLLVIEMNPRVSRSSALASKATGFPIAKIAAKLAVGYTLDELQNDITRTTPASFEPTIDYVVTKVPRFNFEKFPAANTTLTTQMKSVGETMAIGRDFKDELTAGPDLESAPPELLLKAKQYGFSDRQLAHVWHTYEREVRKVRKAKGIEATFKLVDTCAAEFEAVTPYYYSTYEAAVSLVLGPWSLVEDRSRANDAADPTSSASEPRAKDQGPRTTVEDETRPPSGKPRIMVLGG